MEQAKKLSRQLQRNRIIEIQVSGKIVGSKEQDLNFCRRKVALMEIQGITVKQEDGTPVGAKQK